MPRVTVIMATYNWATVLPYSIASVLEQDFTDFELLVIGDACTDNSRHVVESIADRRVHWYELASRTGHQSGPNNEGLQRAQGELIAYLGHDDLWLPSHLRVLVRAMDEGAEVAFASMLIVAPDRRPVRWPPVGWSYSPSEWIPPTAVMHDLALVQAVGSWRQPHLTGSLDPESELWQRMSQQCGPPRRQPELTSVKLPAAWRQGVYRERPHHEQAYWLSRIRSGDDLATAYGPWRRRSQELAWALRTHLRFRTRLRRLGVLPPLPLAADPVVKAEEHWRARNRFKGVDDV
jgi:glycosyltransferase involved in cell wall biosynthesis